MADSLPPSFQPRRKSIRSNDEAASDIPATDLPNYLNSSSNPSGKPEVVQPPSFAAKRRPVMNKDRSSIDESELFGNIARRNRQNNLSGSTSADAARGNVTRRGSNSLGDPANNPPGSFSSAGSANEQLPPAFAPTGRSTRSGVTAAYPDSSRAQSRADGFPSAAAMGAQVENTAVYANTLPGNSGLGQANGKNGATAGASALNSQARDNAAAGNRKKRVKIKRLIAGVLVLILVALICWPLYLYNRANSQLGRVDALSGAASTSGTTYLFVGSDSREDSDQDDGVTGQRSDSIILVHKADNGQTAMVSLPRDTYVEIPGYGMNKINAAFSFGGAALLVETVENLTGLTIDHYVQIGMDGVGDIVDALGGVELCLDYDVSDTKSQLEWEAGCHLADGDTALAFSRMRYSDPLGDIGRAERQRQVLNAVSDEALSWSLFFNPFLQISLVDGGAGALTVDQDTTILDIAQLLLALESATASGLSGTPPIASIAYQTSAGSSVLLDESSVDSFFSNLASGTLTEEDFESSY